MSDGTDPPTTTRRVPTNRYVAFVVVVAVGLAADLWTKAEVFSWPGKLTGQVEHWWWDGHAGVQTSLNQGALFGLGQGAVPLFAAISIVAAVAIPLWLFVGGVARDWWLTLALAAVMAGVLGNLYDRLGLPGEVWPPGHPQAGERVYAVRDWVLWQVNDRWRWPNFNLADAFLVGGAAVLMLRAATEKTPPAAPDAAGSPAGAPPATE